MRVFSRTETILSLREFSPEGQMDGHKIVLSTNYPLVIVEQKFDVRKTNTRFVKFSSSLPFLLFNTKFSFEEKLTF